MAYKEDLEFIVICIRKYFELLENEAEDNEDILDQIVLKRLIKTELKNLKRR